MEGPPPTETPEATPPQVPPMTDEDRTLILQHHKEVSSLITDLLEGKTGNTKVVDPDFLAPTVSGEAVPLDTKHEYGQVADMPLIIYYKRIRASLEHVLVHGYIPNDLQPPRAGETLDKYVRAPPTGRNGKPLGPRRGRRGGRGGGRGRGRGGRRGGRGRGRGRGEGEDEGGEGGDGGGETEA